jgi:hypothetical protein
MGMQLSVRKRSSTFNIKKIKILFPFMLTEKPQLFYQQYIFWVIIFFLLKRNQTSKGKCYVPGAAIQSGVLHGPGGLRDLVEPRKSG